MIFVACKSFYFTYSLLEPYNRIPQSSGCDDEQFRKELDQYFNEIKERPSLLFPWIVNGALAAELALKFLTFRETHTFRITHDLKQLYLDLPPVHRTQLLTRLKAQAHQNEETLMLNLEVFKRAFENFRYPFEKSVGINNVFHDFVNVLYEYSFELDDS